MWTQNTRQGSYISNTRASAYHSGTPSSRVLRNKGVPSLAAILRSWGPKLTDLPPVQAGSKSYLLQVDSRRWPASLAPTYPVPCHVLQGTALVHLYLGRRRNQVSPHQALGRGGNTQELTPESTPVSLLHRVRPPITASLSSKHLPLSCLDLCSFPCLCTVFVNSLQSEALALSAATLFATVFLLEYGLSVLTPQSTANIPLRLLLGLAREEGEDSP